MLEKEHIKKAEENLGRFIESKESQNPISLFAPILHAENFFKKSLEEFGDHKKCGEWLLRRVNIQG